ncbi:MAG: TonB-dependent siderophore receptor, partial [Comamonadaceae bacterium]
MSHIKSRKHAAPAVKPGLSSITAATLVALSMPVVAQTAAEPASGGTLREVRVQAGSDYKADEVASPKYSQPLVDTPQTITVIRKEVLQEQGGFTLTEALRNTPGITLQLGENGNTQSGDSISMRGFDTQGSIFVDNIRDLGTFTRDTFNIEQVEVLKGPTGADVGRASAGGYINLVTKRPTAQDAFSASTSY